GVEHDREEHALVLLPRGCSSGCIGSRHEHRLAGIAVRLVPRLGGPCLDVDLHELVLERRWRPFSIAHSVDVAIWAGVPARVVDRRELDMARMKRLVFDIACRIFWKAISAEFTRRER